MVLFAYFETDSYYVATAGLEFMIRPSWAPTHRDLPIPVSQMLELKVSATMPGSSSFNTNFYCAP